ncbi:hemolysin family protein [Bacillus thuringiensis]|uniref:hemolysin family protein n=1 Tax=Bacillus thuringiensis TaxID=1428 RepID=UPI0021D64EA7|nr:hemolysin family protein [Bacillus thuringiensis]MCU7666948.1 hemolysin family protein [Bacillus thuringiensis]
MVGLRMFFVGLLILATAFFVAAEFAFLRVRSSKIDQLILEGNKRALMVQKVQANLDGYLSACQLGITVTALGLGWLGEPTMELIMDPLLKYIGLSGALSHTLSIIIAFSFITFLHVVAGELAPKTLAIQKAEKISLLLAAPMIGFYRIMYPFIWALNSSSSWVIGLFGLKPTNEHDEVHSEEELRIILSESYQSGEINQAEYKYVNRIFNFDELLAREIMVPRVDMKVIDVNDDLEKIIKTIGEEQYTRYPVVNNDKDEVIGMLHVKELFFHYVKNKNLDLKKIIRPVLTVQETLPVKDLLKKMQIKRIPFALLKDEYGGTSGLVTIEDILEEIVGEIRDEFDNEEKPEVVIHNETEITVANNVLISQVNDLLHVSIDNEEVDTIGGWLYVHNSGLSVNNKYEFENITFTVIEKSKNRYERIRIKVVHEE